MKPRRLAGHYYAVLGVAPSASQQEIKAAYKRLVLQWHPDRFYAREMEAEQTRQQQQQQQQEGEGPSQGLGSAAQWLRSGMGITAKRSTDVAALKFREIVEAYEVLSDERRRQRYNAGGASAGSGRGAEDSQGWASSARRGAYPGGGMGGGAGAWRARRAGSASWQGGAAGSSFRGSWGAYQGAQGQGQGQGGFSDSDSDPSSRDPGGPAQRRDLLWVLLMGWLPSSPGGLSWRSLSLQELGTGVAAVVTLGAALVWGQFAADAAWASANKGKSFEETLDALKKQRERQGQDPGSGAGQDPGPD